MRLLIVGTLKGQLTTATKIAMDNGASVTHAEDHEQAMRVLRGGKGADLLLVDVALDIRDLVMRLEAEHIHVPIVACGITNDARAAVAAIHAPDAAAGADVDVAHASSFELFGASDVVDKVRIATVDHRVARLQARQQIVQGLVDDRGRDHQPDGPWRLQLHDKLV